jgi:CRISPR/Cas system CSM-associated protein Csm3 (group 7 of RAMP superfamily)
MSPRLTLFTATLVQDSALSVSGLDRESSADQPFAIVDGIPTLVGRGLKGAAVAMAKRFFDPLPRAISDDIDNGPLRRSAWEFADATPTEGAVSPRLRAGVGIRHKTGARAKGVLYDREVIPAGTKWRLNLRVDRFYCVDDEEFTEAEGILGYVLEKHWKEGRCWLGGDVARGLGWCHLEDVKAYRLDEKVYEEWVKSGRTRLPQPLADLPVVKPTRSWCFRTLDVEICFGEYQPEPSKQKEPPWGLDMLAIGPHQAESVVQPLGDGEWAKPSWAQAEGQQPEAILTDRPILMDGNRPLIPGASVRGPLRHAFSRAVRAAGGSVQDPHLGQGNVGDEDLGGQAFGTVTKSSRILIRDARAEEGWAAARLHMHAEDEFSAGSYGSAKRDAVRLLKGTFSVRIVVEGATPEDVKHLVALIDRQVALGALGHLPIGGHKTRGAGWGRWKANGWQTCDVKAERKWSPPGQLPKNAEQSSVEVREFFLVPEPSDDAHVRVQQGALGNGPLTLGEAAKLAQTQLDKKRLVAWWCDPAIDLKLASAPVTFGSQWPEAQDSLQVEEVAFYFKDAVWRACRTATGARWVLIEEVSSGESGARKVKVMVVPARLHGFQRFSAATTSRGKVLLRQWYLGEQLLAFTIEKLEQEAS